MKVFRKIMVASWLLLASTGFQACDDASASRMYQSQPLAPTFQSMNLSGEKLYDILGASIVDEGVNFAVYAKNATRVEVLIFDDPESGTPSTRIPMTKDEESGIWTQYVFGVGNGTYYGYIAFGPNWPYDPDFTPGSSIGFITDCDENGNRYNPNKLLMDPYARRIHRDFDWNSGGNPASGTARDISDWQSSPKSVVIKSEYEWSANESKWRENRMKGDDFVGHAQNDLIFYEVHPYGFTAKAVDFVANTDKNLKISIKHPGSFLGIGEMGPYLADLGITAVELLPPTEKPDDGGYWGYNTIQYFAPEWKYAAESSRKKTNGVHDEFKQMVDILHQNGIEVILDVVFNHTGEGGFWQSKAQDPSNSYGSQSTFTDKTAATLYSFRGLDNKGYYHLVNNSAGITNQNYLDETGVGNQLRTNVLPFRRFIVDNLRFWVEEMHVDGFRFDLATILGVVDDQVSSEGGDASDGNNAYWAEHVGETVLQDIIDDDVMAKYHTRFIAEPWSLAQYANGLFPKSTKHENHAWFEWNGRFRDMFRSFVTNDSYTLAERETLSPYWSNDLTMGNLFLGTSLMFGDDGRKPYHSVNIITVHDGFTLYDLNTYNEKNNGCSNLNQICCEKPYDAFCKTDSGESNNRSRDWCGGNKDSQGVCNDANSEAYKRQIIRDFFTIMMVSHGSPLILGGDEMLRTQFGNNDAYSDSANNEWNWFRWGDWTASTNPANLRMHDFVRDLIALRKKFKTFLSPSEFDSTGIQWWGPNGCGDESCYWSGKAIAQYYPAKDDTSSLFIMFNMYEDSRTFTLPEEGDWNVLLDTQSYFESSELKNVWTEGERTTSSSYEVSGRSIVIMSK